LALPPMSLDNASVIVCGSIGMDGAGERFCRVYKKVQSAVSPIIFAGVIMFHR
jgi:hypothetical protein